ncbi:MAG: serine/threonine protein kinase [Pseudanabaena frigida]|uniref:Serine/threonine protein kinase n=1 Tax=Pseudanabaena frigida TaxID=945775 RepID=A0A2W4VX62_9CYAN|nr:MAG: serine/threonine protein kinase [Pseudanabaena frigida]
MLEPQAIVNKRYQLERQLGQNAGRDTWLAKDLQKENELVVVKLLAFGGNVQWENLKLFEREANVLKQLDHPRIPKYRDYFSIDDRSLWFGLVQEYIQGDSLREYIAKGYKFTESQVKQIAIAILEILIYLHELSPQVLHRDLKPCNLVLTGKEGEARNIYLVDFGAVQDKAAAEGKSFTIVGTYGYAPMEQYGGRAVAASDLYALGATLIHLLTGISPADLPQDDDARILFSDRTSASPHLVQWIQKLVEPIVKKRYSSARIALQALREPSQLQPVPTSISADTLAPNPVNRIKRSPSFSSAAFKPYSVAFPPSDTNIRVEQSLTQLRVVIPYRLWTVICLWLLSGIIFLFIQPFLSAIFAGLASVGNAYWLYLGAAAIAFVTIAISLNELTTVTLEVGEKETWLTRSIFGKTSWQMKFPTSAFQGVEPKWRMLEKRNSGFLDNLIWMSKEHNEDNSRKVNIFLYLQGNKYTLATSDIRPTEVIWLIDVIDEFLSQVRINNPSLY